MDSEKKTGETFPVEVSIRYIEINEKGYYIVSVRDISKQEELTNQIKESREKLIEQNKELEILKDKALEAAKIKAQFLSNMSHEIRTPLNGILGLTELLLKTDLNDEQSQYVKMIRSSNRLLLSIVNDILDISAIESGKRYIKIEKIRIKDFIEEIISPFIPLANKKKLKIEYKIDESFPEYIENDARSIKQILINLINNSLKFTEKGKIEVFIGKSSDKLEMVVSDTGIGIEKDKIEKIFERYYQVDSSYKKNYQGTGLGLSIVNELINLLNGGVEIESEVNKGTRITVRIPMEIKVEKKEKRLKEIGKVKIK